MSAYNIPLQRRDPGPDGNIGTADDGPMVTIYDYDPAFRGNAFEKLQAGLLRLAGERRLLPAA